MTNAVEAVIDPSGAVRLLEPLPVTKPRRAVLVLLPDVADEYAALRATDDTPEAKAARAAAVADYRAGNGLTTAEAISYLQAVIDGGGK